jgi:hypothetical protein
MRGLRSVVSTTLRHLRGPRSALVPKRNSTRAAEAPPAEFQPILYKPWEKQARVHLSKARFRVVMAGRQSGKTMLGIAEICHYAMAYPNMVLWWVCPNYTVKPRAWRGLLEFLPNQYIVRKNEAERFITLGNGSTIWVKSADAKNSLVSEGLDGVVCDEAGQWAESAWTMGIRPMLGPSFKKRDADNPYRGWAIFIGTPRGRNWFHRIWLRGDVKASATDEEGGGTWDSFHWKSVESPYSSEEDIREAQETLPRDTFLQEYEADPHDNAQAVFRNHRDCIGPMGEAEGRSCLGIDLGRKHDFTGIVGINAMRRPFHVERFQLDWPQQRARIAALSLQHGAFLEVDATGLGDAFIPSLREAGLQVEPYVIGSNPAKTQLIDYLRLQFEQNSITIPDHNELLTELDTFEYLVVEEDEKKKPLERYQYGAPPGGHDDLVLALALAAWGMRGIPVYATQTTQTSNYLSPKRSRDNYLSR